MALAVAHVTTCTSMSGEAPHVASLAETVGWTGSKSADGLRASVSWSGATKSDNGRLTVVDLVTSDHDPEARRPSTDFHPVQPTVPAKEAT